MGCCWTDGSSEGGFNQQTQLNEGETEPMLSTKSNKSEEMTVVKEIEIDDDVREVLDSGMDCAHELTSLVIRNDIRILFGITFADQWGHFTDHWMSPIIHSYLDWLEYSKGDRILKGHSEKVLCAVFSSDARYLFTGSRDESIIVWNMESTAHNHAKSRQWIAHCPAVYCLAYYPGLLASGGFNEIKIWSEKDCGYQMIRHLKKRKKSSSSMRIVISVCFNKNGTQLISTSDDCKTRIWSVINGHCMRTLSHYDDSSPYAGFIDGYLLIVDQHTLSVWDHFKQYALKRKPRYIKAQIRDVRINQDGSLIACANRARCDVHEWPKIFESERLFPPCDTCDFHPHNPCVLAVGNNQSFQVIIIRFDKIYFKQLLMDSQKRMIQVIRFSPNGSHLICVLNDHTIHIRDVSHLPLETCSSD